MAITSNLVRETTLLPAITKGHLDTINQFGPHLSVSGIDKPHRALWEISGRLYGQQIVLFLSEDGRMIGNISIDPTKTQRDHAVSRRFTKWGDWLGGSSEPELYESDHGFFNISLEYGLLPDLRKWCIDQVVNRSYPRSCDYYGRIWPEGIKRCPICGQPEDEEDIVDCDHSKFSDELVAAYRDEFANTDDKE
jgi:hypothetical protein